MEHRSRKMIRALAIVIAMSIGFCQMLPFASGAIKNYDAPIEHTITITDVDVSGYKIDISGSKKVSWSVTVTTGSSLDVYFMDSSDYSKLISGNQFESYIDYTSKNTKSVSNSFSISGSYVLAVTVAIGVSGNSTYQAKISIIDMTSDPGSMLLIIVVVIIILLPIIIFVVRIMKRKKAAEQPGSAPATIQTQPCPKCGISMKFMTQYQRWYCTTCKSYGPKELPPPQ